MSETDELIKALRGELCQDCRCGAYGRHECGCGLTWPEDVASKAADLLGEMREVLGCLYDGRANMPDGRSVHVAMRATLARSADAKIADLTSRANAWDRVKTILDDDDCKVVRAEHVSTGNCSAASILIDAMSRRDAKIAEQAAEIERLEAFPPGSGGNVLRPKLDDCEDALRKARSEANELREQIEQANRRCNQLEESESKLAAELDVAGERATRLQAIVAKLPKTADGVTVVPGMNVWSDLGMKFTADLRTPHPETCSVLWSNCYSTRDAATRAFHAAAQAQAEGGKDG